MNRTRLVITLSLLFAGCFLALAPPVDAANVHIPDANLRRAINARLGRSRTAAVPVNDILKISFLYGRWGGNVRDLTGLEHATNLRSITLPVDSTVDFTPITGLTKLRSLDLSFSGATDITRLSGLTNLTSLTLQGGITTLTPLSGLTNLTSLSLRGSFTDITPLSGMTKLTYLSLSGNNFTTLTPLAGMTKLTSLTLGGNGITDITPLAGMTKLIFLHLRDNSITNITPLSGMTKMLFLYLSGNSITDITPLSGLTNLKHLQLYNNQIADVTPLSELTNLTILGLGDNRIADVTPLSGLTKLSGLSLDNNQISDVTPLSALKKLSGLTLDNNQITDVMPLSELGTQLRGLTLQNNQISEIAPLNALQKLNSLDIRGNPLNVHASKTIKRLEDTGIRYGLKYTPTEGDVPIQNARLRAAINAQLGSERAAAAVVTKTEMESLTTLTSVGTATEKIDDLRGLSYAQNLTRLNMGGNDITDLTPLSGLTKLEYFWFANNKNLTDITPLANLKELKYLDIWRSKVVDISVIRNFKKLERIQARATGMSDISAAQYTPKFYIFELSWNKIRDLTPILNNPGVTGKWDVLQVEGNPLSYPAIYTQIPALQARSIKVYFIARTPAVPTKSSGDAQTGTVGTALAKPLTVHVNDTDSYVRPFEGVPITWSVTGGGGTLSSTETTTDINGRSSVMLTLGSSPGANTVTASQTHNSVTNTLVFTATGTPLVQQQQAEGEEGGGNKPPKEDPIGVARDRYVLLESYAGDKKSDLDYWHTLKLIYEYKIEGIVGDLSAEKRALRQAVAGKNSYNLLESLLNALDTKKGDELIKKYYETLDRLDSKHQAYTEAIDAADTAYDNYSELTGGSPELEKSPRDPTADVYFICHNRKCSVKFYANRIGYPGRKNGWERWSARIAARAEHTEKCTVDAIPECDRVKRYYGKCPGGVEEECTTKERHILPCDNFARCDTKFKQRKNLIGKATGKVDDSPHHCPEKIRGPLNLKVKCGDYAPNTNRFCIRDSTNETYCQNKEDHLITGDCGHIDIPRHETKGTGPHSFNASEQCTYEHATKGRCQRIGYYRCLWYHGGNAIHGHEYAVESPSQQPSEPATLPSTPEPVTRNEPEPEPVIQPDPEPEEETTVPEEPEEETTVPEEPEEDDDDETSGTTTPTTPTTSPTEDSDDDDDDDSDDSDDDDDDSDDSDDEPAPAPPAPPPTVLCGNRWTGAGACIHNRVTSSVNAHRTTCSSGHTYWSCNRTAVQWHDTSYLCTRSGCNQTYTKCSKGNGSCRARKPNGGTYQWHN